MVYTKLIHLWLNGIQCAFFNSELTPWMDHMFNRFQQCLCSSQIGNACLDTCTTRISFSKSGTCLKLNKLTIAPRLCYQHLFKGLIAAGFTQCKEVACLLYKTNMIIVIYVDDLGFGAANKEDIDILVNDQEKQSFTLTREGSFSELLGIKFNKLDNGDIECTQKGLIRKF